MLTASRKLIVQNSQLGKAWVILGYFRLNCLATNFTSLVSHGEFYTQDSTDGVNLYALKVYPIVSSRKIGIMTYNRSSDRDTGEKMTNSDWTICYWFPVVASS